MAQILNIAGYKFITLTELPALQADWQIKATALNLKGTILLSTEGVNISLAGPPDVVHSFVAYISQDDRFSDMTFRESYSAFQPFHHMKVKMKKEIITLRQPDVRPEEVCRAPAVSPQEFKHWLDEKRDITVLDTRNDYEFRFGTFEGAQNLHLDDFGDFPEAVEKIENSKPIVMFCTGGVRCEKAALVLLNKGFSNVYQLDGGILNYFAEVGGSHYSGECFVFDQRVAVDASLQPTGTVQCRVCQGPVKTTEQELPEYVPNSSCPSCVNHLT